MMTRTAALERSVAEAREESRKAAEVLRQAVAGKAELSDLEVRSVPGSPDRLAECSLWP